MHKAKKIQRSIDRKNKLKRREFESGNSRKPNVNQHIHK